MKIFERSDFGGQNLELMDDCPDLNERFHTRDISSVNVMEGYWMLHEHPNYRGRQYFLRPGEYRRHSEWGSTSPTIGSLRRVTEVNWSQPFVFFHPDRALLSSFSPTQILSPSHPSPPLVRLMPALFRRGLNAMVSKPGIIHFDDAFYVGLWFGWVDVLWWITFLTVSVIFTCFGTHGAAKRSASQIPNLLPYWNYNKQKLDESQLTCWFSFGFCSCRYKGKLLVINPRDIFPFSRLIELKFHQATEFNMDA